MKISVDFDGTLSSHEFPDIGTEVPHAFMVLKELQAKGHELFLWTMRSDGQKYGNVLTEAVEWCRERGIEFKGINQNETQLSWTSSPKLYCQIYIDDAALGCPLKENPKAGGRPYVDWKLVRELLISKGIL